jgi:hypothetical protein
MSRNKSLGYGSPWKFFSTVKAWKTLKEHPWTGLVSYSKTSICFWAFRGCGLWSWPCSGFFLFSLSYEGGYCVPIWRSYKEAINPERKIGLDIWYTLWLFISLGTWSTAQTFEFRCLLGCRFRVSLIADSGTVATESRGFVTWNLFLSRLYTLWVIVRSFREISTNAKRIWLFGSGKMFHVTLFHLALLQTR